jgi:hypothetical protein
VPAVVGIDRIGATVEVRNVVDDSNWGRGGNSMMSADYRNSLARTRAELDARKIAEHGLSRPASLEITTRSERWANP